MPRQKKIETIAWETLKRDYVRELALRGDGKPMPEMYAETSLPRLYYRDASGEIVVEHHKSDTLVYNLWLAMPKGFRCAMRNSNEKRPVYSHDLVDRM